MKSRPRFSSRALWSLALAATLIVALAMALIPRLSDRHQGLPAVAVAAAADARAAVSAAESDFTTLNTPAEPTHATSANTSSSAAALEDALRLRGAEDVFTACTWALAQTSLEPTVALAAVFRGAVTTQPDRAIAAMEQLIAAQPENAASLGGLLVYAFGEAREHERAALFAASGAPELRRAWLAAAFRTWAQHEPETALDAAMALDAPDAQSAAFRAAMSGWARQDPSAAVECAAAFPPGPERKFALLTSLRAWRAADAPDCEAWLETHRAALADFDELARVFED